MARLHSGRSWSARINDHYRQWLQIDLGRPTRITKIATQGRKDYRQWVKRYTISYSQDGAVFTDYKAPNSYTKRVSISSCRICKCEEDDFISPFSVRIMNFFSNIVLEQYCKPTNWDNFSQCDTFTQCTNVQNPQCFLLLYFVFSTSTQIKTRIQCDSIVCSHESDVSISDFILTRGTAISR